MLIGDDRQDELSLQETLHGHPEGLQLRISAKESRAKVAHHCEKSIGCFAAEQVSAYSGSPSPPGETTATSLTWRRP